MSEQAAGTANNIGGRHDEEAPVGPGSGPGGEGDKSKPKMSPAKKKLLRMLTVMAYLTAITSGAFMLSLYYIFLWTPKRGPA